MPLPEKQQNTLMRQLRSLTETKPGEYDRSASTPAAEPREVRAARQRIAAAEKIVDAYQKGIIETHAIRMQNLAQCRLDCEMAITFSDDIDAIRALMEKYQNL